MKSKDKRLFPVFWQIVVFSLFQKNADAGKIVEDKVSEKEKLDEFKRIRCPRCKWQPQKESRWYCVSLGAPEFYFFGCGTSWNTFDTRGKCPGCAHQWRWTTCLACHRDSLHEDWYLEKG